MGGVYLSQVHRGIAWRLMQQGANTAPEITPCMHVQVILDRGEVGSWQAGSRPTSRSLRCGARAAIALRHFPGESRMLFTEMFFAPMLLAVVLFAVRGDPRG